MQVPTPPVRCSRGLGFLETYRGFPLFIFCFIFCCPEEKKILKLVKMWLICFKFNPVIFFFTVKIALNVNPDLDFQTAFSADWHTRSVVILFLFSNNKP